MYAVIATGGKQYRVTEGARIRVEKMEGEPGQQVEFGDVLFVGDDDGSQGKLPPVAKVKVIGTILDQTKGDKIVVFKFKKRKMYRRKQGHRQLLTSVQIDQVAAAKAPARKKKAASKPADKKVTAPAEEAGEE